MVGYKPVKLAYSKFEPESGSISDAPPVIFLHGLSASKEHFADIPQSIANETKRKVYAVDSRNHGDSEWTEEFNFDVNADDLLHFMDTVGEKKAVIIGHSMGGITAMKTALKKPENIEGIIIEDMYARIFPPEIIGMVDIFLTTLKNIVQDIPPELSEKEAVKYAEDLAPTKMPKEVMEFLEQNSGGIKPQYYFALKRDDSGRYINKVNIDVISEAMKKPDLHTELTGTYEGPAHFVSGKLSVFKVLDDADYIKKFFPKAEFTEIERATHNVHVDCPEEFKKVLLKCLA